MEIELCTNDDYNVRETGYLIQIDIDNFDRDFFDAEDWKILKSMDGKYIVSFANYTYEDMINDGDILQVRSLTSSKPHLAMKKYWKDLIENQVEKKYAVQLWNDFEKGEMMYWEDTEEAQQFRQIGAEVLNIKIKGKKNGNKTNKCSIS